MTPSWQGALEELMEQVAALQATMALHQRLIPQLSRVRANYLSEALADVLQQTAAILAFEKADLMLVETEESRLPGPGILLDLAGAAAACRVRTYACWGRTQGEISGLMQEGSAGYRLADILIAPCGPFRHLLLTQQSLQIYHEAGQIERLVSSAVLPADYEQVARQEWEALDQETRESYGDRFSRYLRNALFPLLRPVEGQTECFGWVGFDSPSAELGIGDQEPIPLVRMQLAENVLASVQTIITISGFVDTILKQKNQLDRAYTDLRNAQAAIILQEKLSSLGMLSASIAHGVHNPLFALSVSTRRLEELTGRLGSDWQKLESQGLSAEDRLTLQELLATVGRHSIPQPTYRV